MAIVDRFESARQWIREHRFAAAILTFLSFLFIFLPQWGQSVWSLFSSEPLIPSVLRKMNMQPLAFSLTWITAPIGLTGVCAIFYLLITDRRKPLTDRIKELEQELLNATQRIDALNTQHQFENGELERKIDALEKQIEELKQKHLSEIEALNTQHQAEKSELERQVSVLGKQVDGWHQYAAQYNWLHNLASAQGIDITRYVKLDRIERGDVRLHEADGAPFIKFHFYIVNKSVFDITVKLENDANNDYITFTPDLALRERFLGIPSNELSIPNNSEGCLTIEQRLSYPEANTIARSVGQDNAIFYFDRLTIKIKSRDSKIQPPVDEDRLKIDKGVTLNNEQLTNLR